MNFVFLCAATLPASFALLRDGFFSSSDGMIHLYRLFELDRAIHAGIVFSRWLPLSGYGYGLPVFNYYPPLAYYLAEFFHLLGAGYIGSIKLLIAFGFILAALSMFHFSRDLLGVRAAFVASIAFIYLPYLLSDAYIRGNFPEMLAMSLIPFALYAFRRVVATPNLKFFILASISFALIILTHHLTAMLAAPLLGAYVIFIFVAEAVRTPTSALSGGSNAAAVGLRKLFWCIGAISLSLVLSAFYWVPALTELNLVFVGPASLARFLVSRLVTVENFFAPSLAYSYLPQSDALLHSAGFPQTVAALAVGVATIVSMRARQGNRQLPTFNFQSPTNHAIFFLLVLITSIFMLLNLSAPLWNAIPTLRFMQFPWRFQILVGISIAFLIGVGAKSMQQVANGRWRPISQFPNLLISLSLMALALFNLPDRSIVLTDSQVNLLHSDDSDYVVAQMGWSWTREFVPASVQVENVQGAMTRRAAPDTPRANAVVRIDNDGQHSRTLRVNASEPTEISFHQFFFPGWQAYVDGAPVRTYPSGPLGLVTVNAPAGDHRVEFLFQETPFRLAMDVLSALGFFAMAAWVLLSRRLAFLIAIIFFGSIYWLHPRAASATPPIALSNRFGDNAALISYSTEREGVALYVKLEWFVLRETQDDFVATVQLLDADGKIVAQSDALTDWGVTPTSRWQRGELVTDRRVLPSVPRGKYRLIAGMYLPREGGIDNLAVFDREGNKIGNQVELGVLEIGN